MTVPSKSNVEGSVVESKQVQKAGDNSTQFQVGNMTIVNGITEQRAREIFSEMNEIARRDYTSDAYELAFQRVTIFEKLLMDKVQKVDGLLEAFGDPSFQYLLVDAQRHAAASERENDYATLTELLGCRATQGHDRKIRASISQAVKIVDEVDDDALCGLTASYAVWRMYPLAESCSNGLNTINDAFTTLVYQDLPYGREWLEHLEMLNVVRCTPIVSIRKFENIYGSQIAGYVCAGIKKDSDEHIAALDIIHKNSLPLNTLIDHEWNEGYVRLSVPNIEYIDHLVVGMPNGDNLRTLNQKEKAALREIWNLYSKDASATKRVQDRFIEEIGKRPNIAAVRDWWNALPYAFNLTHIGIVLAHANARQHGSEIDEKIVL